MKKILTKEDLLNRWNFWLGFQRSWDRMHGYNFTFGFFKVLVLPGEGEIIKADKGFLITRYLPVPRGFDIKL